MSRITEMIIEPSAVYVGGSFKLKIRVHDDYIYKKTLVTESGLKLVTEDNKKIRTDWGEK